jgi:penicillin-binding protein 2
VGGQVIARPVPAKLDFGEEALAAVRGGLDKVMNQGGGTGFSWRIKEPGFEMAGKTGTAQVRVYSKEERARGLTKNENLEWKMRDHALFIGYAPVIDPKYAIVSIIEHGAVGAHPHVANARDIMLLCQQRDPSRMPAAYPATNSASAAPPKKQAEAKPVPPQAAKVGG